MPYALVVFDLDGTLVDSRRDIADAANALLIACGAAPIPEADIGRMVGEGHPPTGLAHRMRGVFRRRSGTPAREQRGADRLRVVTQVRTMTRSRT